MAVLGRSPRTARELTGRDPDYVGALIDAYVAAQKIVGAVVMVGTDGGIAYARAAGLTDREAGRRMTEDTIFRLASVTKPMVAATILAMTERGIHDMGGDRSGPIDRHEHEASLVERLLGASGGLLAALEQGAVEGLRSREVPAG